MSRIGYKLHQPMSHKKLLLAHSRIASIPVKPVSNPMLKATAEPPLWKKILNLFPNPVTTYVKVMKHLKEKFF